ncbi:MAG: molybdate ABC transporter substrate-binding protein [Myxococcota bacterium]
MRLLALAMLLCACAGPADAPGTSLEVYAAASLKDALPDLARAFERAHPDVALRLSFAGSQVLRLQLEQGARADVFASADAEHVRALREAGLVGDAASFARTRLALVVPRDAPGAIGELEALPRARRIVIGTDAVPIGRYTRELLRRAAQSYGEGWRREVLARVVSEEANVRLVRAKVALGEADAAIVYASDVSADVREVPLPHALQPEAEYVAATLRRSAAPEAAGAFLAFLRSPEAAAALAPHGFSAP